MRKFILKFILIILLSIANLGIINAQSEAAKLGKTDNNLLENNSSDNKSFDNYSFNNAMHYGVYLNYLLNAHNAEFSTLSGCKSCNPGFTGGFGNGFAIGALFEIPLNNNDFILGARLGYSLRNSNFYLDEKIGNAIDKGLSKPGVTDLIVQHSLIAKLSTIDIEPQVSYRFIDNFRATLGLKAAVLATKSFSQKEMIMQPNDVVYQDTRTKERNIYQDQTIPDAKTLLTYLTFGVSYNYRFSNGIVIAPELKYELPLYSLTSVAWKPSALALGVSLRFPIIDDPTPTYDSTIIIRDTAILFVDANANPDIYLKNKEENKEELEYSDYKLNKTTIIEQYIKEVQKEIKQPIANIDLRGVDANGNITAVPMLTIEEIETEETFPLLPQIFFPQNSSDLAKSNLRLRKADEIANFDEQKINWNTLDIYYELLNIIGKRMRENPSASIVITGCNNNTGEEKNNIELSKNRAESIKQYLQNTWNIEAKRIATTQRNLPEKVANITREEGTQENRRAEIFSDNPNILKPISLKDIQRSANPPIVRITPEIQSESPLAKWKLSVTQRGEIIRVYEGTETPEAIDWIVEAKPIPGEELPVVVRIEASDKNGQKTEKQAEIKINQQTIKKKKYEMIDDKRVERFSLILFDYDKNDVTPKQEEAIKHIKNRIEPNSSIIITGYADRTGEAAYNQALSLERAKNVANSLGIPESRAIIRGAGSSTLLFDNDLPEGRSYNRTVKIVIETVK